MKKTSREKGRKTKRIVNDDNENDNYELRKLFKRTKIRKGSLQGQKDDNEKEVEGNWKKVRIIKEQENKEKKTWSFTKLQQIIMKKEIYVKKKREQVIHNRIRLDWDRNTKRRKITKG